MATKIKSCNILRIVDVETTQLSESTLKFFREEAQATWKDQNFNENIFNVSSILDDYRENEDADENILTELGKIEKLITAKNAAYLRIVFN